MAKTMNELKNELKKMVCDGNSMIARNEAITADFLAKLDELNGEYAKAVEAETYKTIGAKENPIIEAVKAYSFTVQRVTVIKDPKTKQIAEFKMADKESRSTLLNSARRMNLIQVGVCISPLLTRLYVCVLLTSLA